MLIFTVLGAITIMTILSLSAILLARQYSGDVSLRKEEALMGALSAAVRQMICILGINAVLELFLPGDGAIQKYFRMLSGLYVLSLLLKPLGALL